MIKVRRANATDAKFIIESQIKMAHETESMHLDPQTVEKGVLAVFENPTIGTYFIAHNQNDYCGCLLTLPEWSDWRNGTVLWIHSVYVVPSARKLGVFKSMYEHLKDLVTNSSDYRGLRLYVDKTNITAQKVYEKLKMTDQHYAMFEWMK